MVGQTKDGCYSVWVVVTSFNLGVGRITAGQFVELQGVTSNAQAHHVCDSVCLIVTPYISQPLFHIQRRRDAFHQQIPQHHHGSDRMDCF